VTGVGLSAGDAGLVELIPPDRRAANGIPDAERERRMARAVSLVSEAVRDELAPGGVRVSPLGPGWSSDVDVHVTRVRSAGFRWTGYSSASELAVRDCGRWQRTARSSPRRT
jgi:hypothetical protein